ncbi:DNA primase family protein, partial [Saccharolobus solfataricus]
DMGLKDAIIGIFIWNKEKGIFEPFENRLRKKARALLEYYTDLANDELKPYVISKTIIDNVVDEIKDKTLIPLPNEPLRVAFPNCTLEWKISHGRYVPSFVLAEERTPEHFAFHYIPHKIHLEELVKINEEVLSARDIPIDLIEDLARRLCPKSLEVFKQWANEKWVTLFEIIGYTLFPKIEFRKAFMILGPRGTGKSTFINLIKKLLGRGNVVNIPLHILFGDKNRFVLAELYHKLVNAVSETKEYNLDDMDTLKVLTGGDRITADVKFKDPITFTPYAKLVIASNKPPTIRDKNDMAFWHRWLIIEFPNQFEDNTAWGDKTFTEDELEGILTVSILAFSRVLLHGKFDFEQTEEEVRGIWLSTIDYVYKFVKEKLKHGEIMITKNADDYVRVKELYRMYLEYCSTNGYNATTYKGFVRRLRDYFNLTVVMKNVEGKRFRAVVGIKINTVQTNETTGGDYGEFLNYILKNNHMIKEFADLVRDFGSTEKANVFIDFCTKKNMCFSRGIDAWEISIQPRGFSFL